MRTGVILPDGNVLVCVFEDRTAVVIGVQVVRGRKYGNDRRELLRRCFPVHSVTRVLCFMPPEHSEEIVPIQESANCIVSVGQRGLRR